MDWMRFVLVAVLTLAVAACIALAGRWMRRRPTAAVGGGVRLPRIIAVLGWLLAAVGVVLALVAFTDDSADDLLAMRIASVAIIAIGVALVVLHRNWRLAVLDDRVFVRDALGRVRCVVYDEIASSSLRSMRGALILEVRSIDGTRIAVNCGAFDAGPLLQAIAARGYVGHTGRRWG